MAKIKETIWQRALRRVLPRQMWDRPVINEELNTSRLKRLSAEDPVYQLVMDHAVAFVAGELEGALDVTAPAELRIRRGDRAAGVRAFIEDLEVRRQGWNAVAREEETEGARP